MPILPPEMWIRPGADWYRSSLADRLVEITPRFQQPAQVAAAKLLTETRLLLDSAGISASISETAPSPTLHFGPMNQFLVWYKPGQPRLRAAESIQDQQITGERTIESVRFDLCTFHWIGHYDEVHDHLIPASFELALVCVRMVDALNQQSR